MQKDIVLIVDDQEINREILKALFFDGEYQVEEAENGLEALTIMEKYGKRVLVLLLDLSMPVMDGYELLERMGERGITEHAVVFVITASDDVISYERCFSLGVVDVIQKPINIPEFVRKRIENVVELYRARRALRLTVDKQAEQLARQREQLLDISSSIIDMLATTIEFRNGESGEHVRRIRTITKIVMLSYVRRHPDCGITKEQLRWITDASALHDLGKIAIPDNILCKPGRLTKEEFEIMKEHTTRGCEILERIPYLVNSELYQYVYDICRHHHERWDGRGYPDGLKGDEITIWSQIVAVADVYDALVSVRVYKAAYSPDKAVQMITDGECGVFNPDVLECFYESEPEIREFYRESAKVQTS